MDNKNKIEPQLAALIAQNSENLFPVVIVCSSNNISLEKKLIRIMDTIFSGELNGNEIHELESLNEVLSIELDKKITIE